MTADLLLAGHARLLHELGGLRAAARQVLDAHRTEYGGRLGEIAALVADLLEDLEPHVRDEERAGFALRRDLRGDHGQVLLLLDDLRRETGGYRPPEGACPAWRELWRRLAAFDDALREQVRREEGFAAAR